MAVKSKTLSGQDFVPAKPKKTRQGASKNSRPKHNSKHYRGQGRG